MFNGNISDRAKKCITWLVAICTFLLCISFCVRSCQRDVDLHFDARRCRVTIQYADPDSGVNILKKR